VAKYFDNWNVVRDLTQGGQAWTYLLVVLKHKKGETSNADPAFDVQATECC